MNEEVKLKEEPRSMYRAVHNDIIRHSRWLLIVLLTSTLRTVFLSRFPGMKSFRVGQDMRT